MSLNFNQANIKEKAFQAAIFDIEGTTTSISFVKDILFPYSLANVDRFLENAFSTSSHSEIIDALVELSNDEFRMHSGDVLQIESTELSRENKKEVTKKLATNVKYWIGQDKKLSALKQLQGIMWEEAYKSGEIKSHVYDDVLPTFQKLNSSNIPIYIYSSGSVHAQKLLFAHTETDDLTKFITGYFDTKIGAKVDPLSYKRIEKEIGIDAKQSLFVTDVETEAFAAKEADMEVIIMIRPGNAPLSQKAHDAFCTFTTFQQLQKLFT
ncbi:haloacid dehalogenase-like hydrolase domain-containing protein [Ditylenchus destructor]|nr:haloacid dehalogenase-like hydrolase domain-containing protein [Ditylenchus destructor]